MFKLLIFIALFSSLSADRVERFFSKEMNQKNIPGVAVVVIEKGKTRYYHFGFTDLLTRRPVKDDTLFELASITKVFTGTAVAFEVLSGRMNLKESIINYVPMLKKSEIKGLKKVTLGDILTHTASLPRTPPAQKGGKNYSRDQLLKYLAAWSPDRPVGTKYEYSNLSYGLAGFALEGERGETLTEVFEELILQPLGMISTSLDLSRSLSERYAFGYTKKGEKINPVANTWLPASGGLRSTSRDMEKFLAANLGLRGPQNLLKAMKVAREPRFKVHNNLSLGLGWQISTLEEKNLYDKNGGLAGSSSYIGFIPQEELGVVILMNKAKTDSTAMGRNLLKLLLNNTKANANSRIPS